MSLRTSAATTGAERGQDWLLWQLADSAFPTGGFAHSSGLEAAWQHGEVRNRAGLLSWLGASLGQLAHAALPFVTAAHAEPLRFSEFDQLCDAFMPNHVANRASRLQGKALLAAVDRIFPERARPVLSTTLAVGESKPPAGRAPLPRFAHLAPAFGRIAKELGIAPRDAARLFVFMHLRSVVAAAVRLNIVGPMAGQAIQFQYGDEAEAVVDRGLSLTLADIAQTAPLLDLWQGAQDRLYSRLFQS
jgi:urease accessory protein